jgi:hypothetical protein
MNSDHVIARKPQNFCHTSSGHPRQVKSLTLVVSIVVIRRLL